MLNNTISIDETSIYAQMVSSYSRCKLGNDVLSFYKIYY